jgi:hypothetical protein
MKLQPGKLDNLLIDMLIHIQSEVQVLRNFIMTDHMDRTGKNIDTITKEYDEMYHSARTAIIAQIKSRYVDGFNVDDLLSQIK